MYCICEENAPGHERSSIFDLEMGTQRNSAPIYSNFQNFPVYQFSEFRSMKVPALLRATLNNKNNKSAITTEWRIEIAKFHESKQ